MVKRNERNALQRCAAEGVRLRGDYLARRTQQFLFSPMSSQKHMATGLATGKEAGFLR